MPDAKHVLAGAEFDRLAEVRQPNHITVDRDRALARGLRVGEFKPHCALSGRDDQDDAQQEARHTPARSQQEALRSPRRRSPPRHGRFLALSSVNMKTSH